MLLVSNKKANFDYAISKKYTAGIVLTGAEVKSLRLKQASLSASYVKIINGELWLLNAQVNPYAFARHDDYDSRRSRKLLLKKHELDELDKQSQLKGWTIVALAISLDHNKIKVLIGIGKGKKEYEKRENIKKRDLKRELSKKMKNSQLNF